jgi:hypothetical protein
VGREIRERWLELVERHGASAIADHARPRAETAVDRAAIGRQEKRTVGVSLDQMRSDLVDDLAERIFEIASSLFRFVGHRDALPTNGAVRIASIDQG